jgi:hypothetical protein
MEKKSTFLREYINEEINRQFYDKDSKTTIERFTPHPSSMSKNQPDE